MGIFLGTAGADTLTGNASDDQLTGALGNDSLDGAGGSDTAIYAGPRSRYLVTPDGVGGFYVKDTIADVTLNEGTDRLANIEFLQFSDATYAPAAIATGAILNGGPTASTILGAAGDDSITSGAGYDTMIGGAGNDTYVVNDPNDVVIEDVNAGFDTVKTSLSTYVMPANIELLNYTGNGSFVGIANDLINAVIYGSSGPTTLIGGAGNDTFVPRNSDTKIIVPANAGYYTVSTNLSYVVPEGIPSIRLFGNGLGNNLLVIANSMNNVFLGDAGSQQMDGAGGNDTFTGAGGNDIYIVSGTASGHDVVTDWISADKVRIGVNFGIYNFADVSSHLSQTGSDVLLTLNPDSSILFKNTTLSAFTADNFQFPINTAALTLTFADEFNTLSLSNGQTGTWSTTYGFSGAGPLSSHTLVATGEKEIYVDPSYSGTGNTPLGLNPFSIDNGVLSITAHATPADAKPYLSNYDYYSGLLTSEPSSIQTYGYFEMRAQLPTNQGAWPAFWLIPANGLSPPEIDILEAAGSYSNYPKQVAHDDAFPGTKVSAWTYTPGAGTSFHTYGLLWTPTNLIWYIDGVAVYQAATPADMNQPMYMVLNLALGGIDPVINAATVSDSSYKIDYVHAYSIPGVTIGDVTTPTLAGSTANADIYIGTTGDDQISGTIGAANGKLKEIDGRDGIDTVVYTTAKSNYSVYSDDHGGYFIVGKSGGTQHLTGIEYIKFSDTGPLDLSTTFAGLYVQGTPTYDVVFGDFDNDVIFGYAGNDYIYGLNGNDTINGGPGNDFIDGGAGNNISYYSGALANFTIYGDGIGGFYVKDNVGSEGFDHIVNIQQLSFSGTLVNAATAATALWLVGTSAADTLTGAGGADVLTGGAGDDSLDGGAGSDTAVYARAASTYAVYGDGSGGYYVQDTAVGATSEGLDHLTGIEKLQFSSGTVTPASQMVGLMLRGTTAGDSLTGGTGTDILTGGLGDDSLDGGAGADQAVYAGPKARYSVYGQAGGAYYLLDTVTSASGEGVDRLNAIETLKFSDGAVAIAGVAGGSALIGTTAAEALTGGTGNDLFIGGLGNDTLVGGTGTDTAIFTGPLARYLIYSDGAGGYFVQDTDPGAANEGIDQINGIEMLRFSDAVVSPASVALGFNLVGTAADETLTGSAGGDTLDGAAGADTLIGGAGDDLYVVDNYGDAVIEVAGGGFDMVQTSKTWVATAGSAIERVVALGATSINLTGNLNAMTLEGTSAMNILDDGGGADTLKGFAGNDTYIVHNAATLVVEAAGEGSDVVKTDLGAYALTDNVETLSYIGTGNFFGVGNALANVISGGAGNDTLDGGLGADRLVGGLGDDTYYVDSASDIITENAGEGYDTQITSLVSAKAAVNVEALVYNGAAAFTGYANATGTAITGGGANDTLSGGVGADTLNGGLGADYMAGGAGDDVYVVDNALDRVVESAGNGFDTVRTSLAGYTLGTEVEALVYTGAAAFTGTGNASANKISGGDGADSLSGANGDDTLTGGGGNDTLVGGIGADVASYAGALSRYLIVADGLGGYTVQDTLGGAGDEGKDTLSGVEWLKFSDGLIDLSTYMPGPPAATPGPDTLTGTAGPDTLDGAAGADSLTGGLGDDLYIVDNAGDVVVETAGGGFDTVQTSATWTATAGSAIERIVATGATAVNLTGNALAMTLEGNSAANMLDDGGGADTLKGMTGADTYVVHNAATVVVEAAGEGVDLVKTDLSTYGLTTDVENLTYIGASAFTGTGNALANLITGGTGNDTLTGAGGDDSLIGGAGVDTAVYAGPAARYVVTPDGLGGFYVQDTLANADGKDQLTSIEWLKFSDGLVDLNNLTSNVSLVGTAAADTLTAGAGNDTLDGAAGADSLVGGGGNDLYIVDNAGDVVVEAVGGGFDTVQTSKTWIATGGSEIERIVATGTASINLTGNSFAMALEGNSANNTLDDGGGSDTLKGFAGGDTYVVHNAGTVVVEAVNEGADLVKTDLAAYLLTDNVENLTYIGAGSFTGYGNALANVITGGAGNDTLDGGVGADRLVGGLGDDTYYVDSASDTITENVGEGYDTQITSLVSAKASANIEALIYGGTAAFTGYANATGTAITGGVGADTLSGAAGDDVLNGGAGNDYLTGGAGADVFRFDGLGLGVDKIADFQVGVDHIALKATGFGVASLADLDFVTGVGPAPISGHATLLYDTATGGLFFDANGGDGADKVQIATLTNKAALHLSDFWLA
ncbi:hypothetical protein BH10PSE4_BH10PSE4_11100 [soil metagenome]